MDERDTDFDAYVAARQARHLRTAFLLTGDRHLAEDLVQNAYAKLYLAWHRVGRIENLDGYVRRMIVNEHTSWWRRAWWRNEVVVDGIPEQRHPDDDSVADVAQRDALWSIVLGLPPRQRAAVVLRFYEDLSVQQTAEVLGCTEGTVKSQTSKGIAAMRQALQEVSER